MAGEAFPWGTLAVNVTGSLVIGLFLAATAPGGRLAAGEEMRAFVAVGLCGGFTTFSAFSMQTFALIQQGDWLRAALNVAASVVLCLVAVWLGHAAGSALGARA
jgi:CrcB protein